MGEDDQGVVDPPEHAEEAAHPARTRGNFTDAGLYSTLIYGFSDALAVQFRAEYVSGVDKAGLDERWRLSPGITWRPSSRFDVQLRAQYNFDQSSAFGEEHTVWTQVKIGWGGGHVE